MSTIERPRRPRADAMRSRSALLAAARQAFLEGEIDIRMDAIATRAGVGVGTLYRHFPDRAALIEAVYEEERDELVAAADRLLAEQPSLEGLRAWLLLFVDYAETKQAMTPVLNTLTGGATALYARTGAPIGDAIIRLATPAVRRGELRPDIDPVDLLRAVYGVCSIAGDRPDEARKFVDIVLKGARP